MKLPEFAYERPSDLPAALALLADTSQDTRVLAGGQSLIAALNFRLGDPDLLVDITRIESLRGITETQDTITIGALTRHVDVLNSDVVARHLPLINRAIQSVAHPAIRNRGTFGGSIALADPAAEMPACLLALDGRVVIAGAAGERRVRADDYFIGLYETDLQASEIITAVEFRKAVAPHRVAFDEVARRHGDYAMTGVAIAQPQAQGVGAVDAVDSVQPATRIVLFGVSDRPVRALAAEAVLAGQQPDLALATSAADLAADGIEFFADVHASAPMKRHLARVLTRRALASLISSET